jgi:hypothetical protein
LAPVLLLACGNSTNTNTGGDASSDAIDLIDLDASSYATGLAPCSPPDYLKCDGNKVSYLGSTVCGAPPNDCVTVLYYDGPDKASGQAAECGLPP